MNASSYSDRPRAAIDPALDLYVDRYECSMIVIAPRCKWQPLRQIGRTLAIGLAAMAATIGGYLLQVGR